MPSIDPLILFYQSVILLLQTGGLSAILLSFLQELQKRALSFVALLNLSPELLIDVLDSLVVVIELVVLDDKLLVVLRVDVLIHLLEGQDFILVNCDLLPQLLHYLLLVFKLCSQVFYLIEKFFVRAMLELMGLRSVQGLKMVLQCQEDGGIA